MSENHWQFWQFLGSRRDSMPATHTTNGSDLDQSQTSSLPFEVLTRIQEEGVVDSWEYTGWVRHQGRLQRTETEALPPSPIEMVDEGEASGGHGSHEGAQDAHFGSPRRLECMEYLFERFMEVSVANVQGARRDPAAQPMGSFKLIKPDKYTGT